MVVGYDAPHCDRRNSSPIVAAVTSRSNHLPGYANHWRMHPGQWQSAVVSLMMPKDLDRKAGQAANILRHRESAPRLYDVYHE